MKEPALMILDEGSNTVIIRPREIARVISASGKLKDGLAVLQEWAELAEQERQNLRGEFHHRVSQGDPAMQYFAERFDLNDPKSYKWAESEYCRGHFHDIALAMNQDSRTGLTAYHSGEQYEQRVEEYRAGTAEPLKIERPIDRVTGRLERQQAEPGKKHQPTKRQQHMQQVMRGLDDDWEQRFGQQPQAGQVQQAGEEREPQGCGWLIGTLQHLLERGGERPSHVERHKGRDDNDDDRRPPTLPGDGFTRI